MIFAALRWAGLRPPPGGDVRRRVLVVMAGAGCLMLLSGLLAVLLPGMERSGLLGGVAFLGAAVYFGATLVEWLRARGRGRG
jgi:hypothetical protein